MTQSPHTGGPDEARPLHTPPSASAPAPFHAQAPGPSQTQAPQRRQITRWAIAGVALAAAGGGVLLQRSREPTATAGSAGSPGAAGTVGSSGSASPAAASGERIGAEFWDAGFQSPQGEPLPMAQWRDRPLLLNFWATWCPPCVREMPLLDAFARQAAPQGLVVVGLAVDSPTPVKGYLQKTPVSFPIAMAGANGTELSRLWGNRMGGLPFSVLVGRDGRILDRHVGELQDSHLQNWLRRLG